MTHADGSGIFDVHAHLISDDHKRYPHAPLGGVVDETALRDPMTAGRLLREMDDVGVVRAVVVQRAHVYGTDNRYVVDAAAACRDRFCALVLVDAMQPGAITAVNHWVGERNAIGVRLTAPSRESGQAWLSSPEADGVWRAVADAGSTMRVHFYAWNRDWGLVALDDLARRFPDVPIVLDHLSNLASGENLDYDGPDDALKAVSGRGNVSIMFSTINAVKCRAAGVALHDLVKDVVGIFGPDRVMWGSDVGQSKASYVEMVAMAHQAVSALPEIERAIVLRETAERIYGSAIRS